MTNAVRRLAGAALILSASFTAAAQAQTAATRQEPPPQADAGTTGQSKCIDENDHYKMRGKQPTLVIELAHRCEQRLKCRVFAYVTSAKGAAQGRGTIVLAPKSQGAAAKMSYAMKVKMIGGSSQSARECKVF
jgi:hypothetical protein